MCACVYGIINTMVSNFYNCNEMCVCLLVTAYRKTGRPLDLLLLLVDFFMLNLNFRMFWGIKLAKCLNPLHLANIIIKPAVAPIAIKAAAAVKTPTMTFFTFPTPSNIPKISHQPLLKDSTSGLSETLIKTRYYFTRN